MEGGLINKALAAGALLLLAGCAAAPPWQPPATHPVIAVTSVLNPYSSLYVSGDSATDRPRQAHIVFDVNKQIRDALHADLAGTNQYRIVDMDVDPGTFAVAELTQRPPSPLHPHGPFTLDSHLADPLVEQAQKMGADYVVAAVDIRYHPTDCNSGVGCAVSLLEVLLPDGGWGLHYPLHKQCDLDTSVYLNYYVFVIDVDSGDTVASFETDNDRYIKGLDIDHQDLGALPDAQKAEIGADLTDMVQKSVDASLIKLNLVPGGAAAGPVIAPCSAPAQASAGAASR